jgi:hypothetical protein
MQCKLSRHLKLQYRIYILNTNLAIRELKTVLSYRLLRVCGNSIVRNELSAIVCVVLCCVCVCVCVCVCIARIDTYSYRLNLNLTDAYEYDRLYSKTTVFECVDTALYYCDFTYMTVLNTTVCSVISNLQTAESMYMCAQSTCCLESSHSNHR